MKTVLLAIAGEKPDHKVFDYAVALSRRIKARLHVLQIIRGSGLKSSAGRIAKITDGLRRLVDQSMIQVTFAEAGEAHPLGDFPAVKREICSLTVMSGEAAPEIIDYIHSRGDIVIAVYDPSLDRGGRRNLKQKIPVRLKQKISVPLVTLQS